MDIRAHNRMAWDRQVENRNPWSVPVDPQTVAAARRGEWSIFLTPTRPVPREWLGEVSGRRVLCLASGGGQQGPILAAAGAEVTVLDNSPRQLEQDRLVANREGLRMNTVEGDMADLSMLPSGGFDIIIHPVSNVFVPDVRPVWRESHRVLSGGVLLSGFMNPAAYLIDYSVLEKTGRLEIRYPLPYADVDQLSEEEKRRYREEGIPFEFSHTLTDQIGGQIDAGFLIAGFFEDVDREGDADPFRGIMPRYLATRAIKR